MLKVSESYIVGVDITEDDVATISVSKYEGCKFICKKLIQGEDALKIYTNLLN